jgi:glutamate racemase
MADARSVGVFDSGVGGLTVVRAIMDALPNESVVYFGDTARCPYGPRPLEEIRDFALQIEAHLLAQDVKALVVACNAASSAALEQIEAASPVPVVAVIDPAVRSAVRATRNGRVGLIGTVATVSSGAYDRALARLDPAGSVTLLSQACPLFVEFVERGDTTSPALLRAAAEYLEPLQRGGVDTLILGCTHYPLLRGAIHHVMGPGVLLLSSAEETANDVYEVLAEHDLLREDGAQPRHRFESSGDAETFLALGRRFLGPEFHAADRVDLSARPAAVPGA